MRILKIWLCTLVLTALAVSAQAQYAPVYNIENVTGDLYRFQSNDFYGVFLVTDEGIILADPISHDTAVWLKGELDQRFEKNVVLVIYSHSHPEHISGGEVFADTAVFVAQENAVPELKKQGIEPLPHYTFKNNAGYEVGGKRVEVYFFGQSHTYDLATIYFPGEEAIFLVDAVAVESLPYEDMVNSWIPNVGHALYKIQKYLDFKILVPGHGNVGEKEDLSKYLAFTQTLNEEVNKAYLKGLTLEEAKQEITLRKYRNWNHYDEKLGSSIEALWARLSEPKNYLPLKKADPIYPRSALNDNVCGFVTLQYDVTKEGKTENFEVIEAEPKGYFEKPAIRAAKKYIYQTGKRVEGVQTYISFELPGVCEIFNPFGPFQPE